MSHQGNMRLGTAKKIETKLVENLSGRPVKVLSIEKNSLEEIRDQIVQEREVERVQPLKEWGA